MAVSASMAAMRQQAIPDDSFSEAEAMRLVRSLAGHPRTPLSLRPVEVPSREMAISRTVQDQVIPRLLEACLGAQAEPPAAGVPPPMNAEVAALTEMLLTGTQPEAAAFVSRVEESGVSRESLFLNLFTPAARQLGVMWAEDDCDFADVTIGMLRLANVKRLVGDAFEAEMAPVLSGPRALLVQAPGEQHGFGVAMVASFFRRAGWNVCSEPVADSEALVALVQREWFSLIGLSVACTNRLDAIADSIRAIRAASRNPVIGVMLGGSAFMEHPQLAAMLGADCTARDARDAVAQADALVSHMACR